MIYKLIIKYEFYLKKNLDKKFRVIFCQYWRGNGSESI